MTDNEIGHNSGLDNDAAQFLKSRVERILRLEEEKAASAEEFSADIADLRTELKSKGYDTAVVAEMMRRMRWEKKMAEKDPGAVEVLDLYTGVFA